MKDLKVKCNQKSAPFADGWDNPQDMVNSLCCHNKLYNCCECDDTIVNEEINSPVDSSNIDLTATVEHDINLISDDDNADLDCTTNLDYAHDNHGNIKRYEMEVTKDFEEIPLSQTLEDDQYEKCYKTTTHIIKKYFY